MTQSKRESLLEANVNTWTGLIGSWLITYAVFQFLHVLGLEWATSITVALCTVWSLVRGYYVRRFFNWRQSRRQYSAL